MPEPQKGARARPGFASAELREGEHRQAQHRHGAARAVPAWAGSLEAPGSEQLRPLRLTGGNRGRGTNPSAKHEAPDSPKVTRSQEHGPGFPTPHPHRQALGSCFPPRKIRDLIFSPPLGTESEQSALLSAQTRLWRGAASCRFLPSPLLHSKTKHKRLFPIF